MPDTPLPTYKIGSHISQPTRPCDRDPRGILWLWEEPHPAATYVTACDPTVGIPNWNRSMRSGSDHKTDNAAIEVIRIGAAGKPDVQVAEFAAPIPPIELAPILNHIGRLFCGSNEEGEGHIIIEVYPGPGLLLQHELMSKYGYGNIYQPRYLNTRNAQVPRTQPYGWTATKQSVTDLWVMGLHHINNHRALVRSEWLIDEMANCVRDEGTMQLKAAYGNHDDRVRAFLLALWAGRDWAGMWTEDTGPVEDSTAPDWQRSGISLSEMMSQASERFSDLLDD